MLENDKHYGKEMKQTNRYQIYKDWDCTLGEWEKVSMRKWSYSTHLRCVILGSSAPQAEGAAHETQGRSIDSMFEAGGPCGPRGLARAGVVR